MLGSLALLAAPAAHAAVFCTGTIAGQTINDTVIVPSGGDCTLSNDTINGNVVVQQNGALFLQGSTVNGSVTGQSPRWIRIDALGPCTRAGDPTSCVRRTTITGNVSISGTSTTPPGFPANYICNGTTVGGSLSVNNSTAPWAIGSPNVCSFGGNTFNGSVSLSNNTRRIDFANNSVGGSVTASNNTGGGSVVNNNIRGSLTLSGNCPAWEVGGNTVGGTTSDTDCAVMTA